MVVPKQDAPAAVADPTPVGSPEVPALPDQETEVTEPETRQEPSEEESGAEKGEETTEEQPADPLEAFVADFTDSVNEDPELAKRMLDALPQELRDSLKGPEADKSEWEAGQARQTRLQAASQAAAPFSGQNMAGRAKDWADKFATNVRQGAQGLLDSQEGPVDLLDAQKMAGEVTAEVEGASTAGWHWGSQTVENSVFDVLEKSAAHKHLSPEDKATLKAGARAAEAVALYLAAAERSAPESIKTKATADAEKKAGILGRAEKLRAALSKNGKAPKVGTAASGQPRDEQEARNWNATGKWSAAKLRAWINSQ